MQLRVAVGRSPLVSWVVLFDLSGAGRLAEESCSVVRLLAAFSLDVLEGRLMRSLAGSFGIRNLLAGVRVFHRPSPGTAGRGVTGLRPSPGDWE